MKTTDKLKINKIILAFLLTISFALPQNVAADVAADDELKANKASAERRAAAERRAGNGTSGDEETRTNGDTGTSDRNPPAATVGYVSAGCPFQNPSSGVMDLVNRVQSTLRTINREENACNAAVQQLIADAERQLESLNTLQSSEVFPNQPGTMNCANYEAMIRQQFDFAVASNSGTIESTTSYNSGYNRCRSAEDFNSCAEQVYVDQLSAQEANCRNTRSGQNNQAIRQSLTNITGTLDSLIQSAGEGGCNANATGAIVQTAIAQATTTASMAAGFGLVGVGIGLAGKLFSSLATRLFDNNSAERYLRLIAQDVSNPARFCLFYDVQKAALRCEQDVYQNALIVGGVQLSTNLCEVSRDALTDLMTLSGALTDAASRETLLSRLNSPVGTTGKNYVDLLRDANQFLRSSAARDPSGPDGAKSLALGNVLNLYDQLMNNVGNDSEEALLRTATLRTELLEALGNANLQLPDVLGRYMQSAPAGAPDAANPASALSANANVLEIIRRTNQNIRDAQQYITNTARSSADSAVMDRLLSAVNSNIGPGLEDELERLFNQYRQEAGSQGDATREMSTLGRMLNICMSTQGAAYFNRANTTNARDRKSVV